MLSPFDQVPRQLAIHHAVKGRTFPVSSMHLLETTAVGDQLPDV